MQNRSYIYAVVWILSFAVCQQSWGKEGVIRAGIIGCDTSHVEAFTKIINKSDARADQWCRSRRGFPRRQPRHAKRKHAARARLRQKARRHGC